MIDFRYHIVSIVSIFLALAVGIVLGAGPLKGEIGSTLQSEVASLRTDKTNLNGQLKQTQTQLEQRDAFLGAVSDRVLAGMLQDRTVAVVVLPGADAAVAESIVTAVGQAGGRVASTTSVSADWVATDEATVTKRDEAIRQALTASGVDTSDAAEGIPPRDALLATLLTRSAPAGDSGPDDTAAQAGLKSLQDAGLLSVDADQFTRGELVVVVGGAVSDGDENAQTAEAESWVTLTTALDNRSRGTVLAADVGSESTGVSVLATMRKESKVTSAVSSVDDAGDPMGVASVVFALREQDGGDAGQYGLATGADAAYAPVPGQ